MKRECYFNKTKVQLMHGILQIYRVEVLDPLVQAHVLNREEPELPQEPVLSQQPALSQEPLSNQVLLERAVPKEYDRFVIAEKPMHRVIDKLLADAAPNLSVPFKVTTEARTHDSY